MDRSYTVKEVFLTLQGEGANSGRASVFLRFTGCNLWNGTPEGRASGKGDCAKWCDTDFLGGDKFTAPQLVDTANALWGQRDELQKFIVLTGGEPTLQLDESLVVQLQAAGWTVAVETNGTVDNPALAIVDWVCLSPKRGARVRLATFHEIKVVLPGGWTKDELRALEVMAKQSDCQFAFVQPQDTEGLDSCQTCVEFVTARPYWRLSYQTHKALGLR
jgi:7-carboxy-7-deazaguanine synthase